MGGETWSGCRMPFAWALYARVCEREREKERVWETETDRSPVTLQCSKFLCPSRLLLLAPPPGPPVSFRGWSPDQLQVIPSLFGDFPGHYSLSPRNISSPRLPPWPHQPFSLSGNRSMGLQPLSPLSSPPPPPSASFQQPLKL